MEQSSPVVRLLLLGVPTVECSATGAASLRGRRRPLALLAVLAAAGDEGISRDRLLALLWPESDAERASNSLRQVTHTIRQQLGDDAIVGNSLVVQLNSQRVRVDVRELDAAAVDGRWEQVAALYRGPYLEGFYVRDHAELEQFIEAERSRIARVVRQALEHLAAVASREGRHDAAVDAWRRVTSLDPLSARSALGLLRELVASGDRAGAIEHGRVYESLVRSELDAEPDPSVQKFLQRLRRPAEEPGAEPPAPAGASQGTREPPRPARSAVAPPVLVPDPAPPRRMLWRAGILVAAAVVVLGFALLLGRSAGHLVATPHAAPANQAVVAVLPFDVSGAEDAKLQPRAISEFLAASIDGLSGLDARATTLVTTAAMHGAADSERTMREVAERVGARLVIRGMATRFGDRVRIVAGFHDPVRAVPDGPPVVVEGRRDELLQLVDDLARQLAASRLALPRQRLQRSAAAATRSIPALRAFMQGEARLDADAYLPAAESFRAAVARDSALVLGYYRLAVAADLAGQDSLADWAVTRAMQRGESLEDRDLRLLDALRTRRAGALPRAESLYESLVDDYPDDLDAWMELAELRFRDAPLHGRSVSTARSAFERVLALDAGNVEALVHLARIASLEGRTRDADSLVRAARARVSDPRLLDLRALRAFALNDGSGRKRATRALLSAPLSLPRGVSLLGLATSAPDVEGTESFARALAAGHAPEPRGFGDRRRARRSVARGEWRPAVACFDSASAQDPVPVMEQQSLLATQPFVNASRAQLVSLRDRLLQWDARRTDAETVHDAGHAGMHRAIRLHRIALVSIRLGDTSAARAMVDSLRRLATDSSRAGATARTFAFSLRAHLDASRGQYAEALRMLDSAGWTSIAPVFDAEAADRFLRADLLARVGHPQEAVAWYASIAERAAYELPYLAPAQWRIALLHANGDPTRAAASRAAAEALWRHADQPIALAARP